MKHGAAETEIVHDVVLVHGFLQDASTWDDVSDVLLSDVVGGAERLHTPEFQELYKLGRDWVADMRAHAWEHPDIMLPLMVDDLGYLGFGLRAYLEQLVQDGAHDITLVGYSMGGRIVVQCLHDALEGVVIERLIPKGASSELPEAACAGVDGSVRTGETVCGSTSSILPGVHHVILESAGLGPEDFPARERIRVRNQTWARDFGSCTPEQIVQMWQDLPLFSYERDLDAQVRERARVMRLRVAASGEALRWVEAAGAHRMPDLAECIAALQMFVQMGRDISYVFGTRDEKYSALAELLGTNGVVTQGIEAGHDVHECNPRAFSEYLRSVLNA